MKETIKTSRTAGYLEKIFRTLNAQYFNNEIEEPIITIQSTPRAYGHVTVAKAWSITEPTEALIDFIIAQGWEDIHMNRNEGFSAVGIGGKGENVTGTGTATKKGNSRKLV